MPCHASTGTVACPGDSWGQPGDSQGQPWTAGGQPEDSRGQPGDSLGTARGQPGTAMDSPGDSPGDSWGTAGGQPGDSHGQPGDSRESAGSSPAEARRSRQSWGRMSGTPAERTRPCALRRVRQPPPLLAGTTPGTSRGSRPAGLPESPQSSVLCSRHV